MDDHCDECSHELNENEGTTTLELHDTGSEQIEAVWNHEPDAAYQFELVCASIHGNMTIGLELQQVEELAAFLNHRLGLCGAEMQEHPENLQK